MRFNCINAATCALKKLYYLGCENFEAEEGSPAAEGRETICVVTGCLVRYVGVIDPENPERPRQMPVPVEERGPNDG